MQIRYILTFILLFSTVTIEAQEKSTFDYYELATNYSKAKDSINASAAFLKVSPYHLFYMRQTPAMLDKFYKKFALTIKAKEGYRQEFTAVYNAPKSMMYDSMLVMHNTYKALKSGLDTSRKTEDRFLHQIDKSDSVYAEVLYRYVQKNGWPSPEDGGLYAGQLLLRDYWHYKFYSESNILSDAVTTGQLSKKIKDDYETRSGNLEVRFKLSELLKNGYLSFDVTSVVYANMPNNMADILRQIKEFHPVYKMILIYDGNNKTYTMKKGTQWKYIFTTKESDRNFVSFHNSVYTACGFTDGKPHYLSDAIINSIYTGRRSEKLTLYIIKGR